MMNLSKRKTGDWDVLIQNINMIIGDVSEDYGWELTLFFGELEPVVEEVEVQIGKVPAYVVIPFHQFLFKVKGDLLIPTEEQMLADIFMPIRLPQRTQELFQIMLPLGLVCDETDILAIQMDIRLSRWLQSPLHQKLLVIEMPLRLQGCPDRRRSPSSVVLSPRTRS